MKSKIILTMVLLVGAIVAAVMLWPSPPSNEVMISLRELPGVTQDVLSAQGRLFRVAEPFLYNRTNKMAVFVVDILSSQNFDGNTHLVFGGDNQSLRSFANEIRLVNSGPSRFGGVGDGMTDGIESLVGGVWQLLRHPIDTVVGLGQAAAGLAVYLKDTSFAQVNTDVGNLVDAFYINRASEVAEAHDVDYFELKTAAGKSAVHAETNFRLGGQASVEIATILVPFSKLKYSGEAAKAAEAANAAAKLAETAELGPKVAKFARAGQLFPRMLQKMVATLNRLQKAVLPRRFNPSVATLGKAASEDYAATFFTRHPQVQGQVVVHHAVEKQVLTRYPGVLNPQELHSLENLRGIPKTMDAILHKSHIRNEWNEFYRANPANTMTKQKLLAKASEIDGKFGHLFQPKLL